MTLRYFLVILSFYMPSALGQGCESVTGLVSIHGYGTKLVGFIKPIEVRSAKGNEAITINGYIDVRTLYLDLVVVGGENNIKQRAPIIFEFTDGQKMQLKNQGFDSQKQKAMLFFGKNTSTFIHLKSLANKNVSSLEIITNPDVPVKVMVPLETAQIIRESIRCLGRLIGLQSESEPVPEVTVVLDEGENGSDDPDKVFTVVEYPPEFPGGYAAMQDFINTNINYLPAAKKDRIGGTVYISFTVTKEGSIIEPQVSRGIRKDLNAEALRIVNLFPKWKPGMQKGRVVNVRFTFPIKFEVP